MKKWRTTGTGKMRDLLNRHIRFIFIRFFIYDTNPF